MCFYPFTKKMKEAKQTKYPVAVKVIEVDDTDMGECLWEMFLQLSLCDNYILRVFGMCWRSGLPFEGDVNHGQNKIHWKVITKTS